MSAKKKEKVWKRNFIFIIIVSCLVGCDENSIQQSSTNANTNTTLDKSQRFNFASSNSTFNRTNSNLPANSAENSANEVADTATDVKMSEKAEISEIAQPDSTPADLPRKSSTDSQFDSAATQNQNSAKNLVWAFGGRSQTGWYIYKPMICRTIGVESDASDNDFAESLAGWQKANKLAPSGVLDAVTLALFVANWQANRLKFHGYASPSELMFAPTADFFDTSRPDELRQVEHATYAAYKKLVAAAIADKSLNLKSNGRGELAPAEQFLKIVSAFRSKDYQDKLRKESPNSGRAGLAVNNSPHFTGRALDVYVGGEPVTTKDENRAVQVKTPVYLWLVKNAAKFGFRPYFYEPWHWEYAPD